MSIKSRPAGQVSLLTTSMSLGKFSFPVFARLVMLNCSVKEIKLTAGSAFQASYKLLYCPHKLDFGIRSVCHRSPVISHYITRDTCFYCWHMAACRLKFLLS